MGPNLGVLRYKRSVVGIGLGDDEPVKRIPCPRLLHGMFQNRCEWKPADRQTNFR